MSSCEVDFQVSSSRQSPGGQLPRWAGHLYFQVLCVDNSVPTPSPNSQSHPSVPPSLGSPASYLPRAPVNCRVHKISPPTPCPKSALHTPASLWLPFASILSRFEKESRSCEFLTYKAAYTHSSQEGHSHRGGGPGRSIECPQCLEEAAMHTCPSSVHRRLPHYPSTQRCTQQTSRSPAPGCYSKWASVLPLCFGHEEGHSRRCTEHTSCTWCHI